jgi:flavin-dependent dehydrogenase
VLRGGAPALRTTTFHYDDESVEVPIKPRFGVDCLVAPRRTLLDPILAAAARRAGADVQYGAAVRGLLRGPDGRVRGVAVERGGTVTEVSASLVIGADGVRSTVARLVDAPMTRVATATTAIVYGYWPDLAFSGTNWFFPPRRRSRRHPHRRWADLRLRGGAAGALRGDARRSRGRRRARSLRGGARAGRASPPAAPRRAATVRRPPRLPAPVARPGLGLVGDAGYFKDPLSAHGITDALRDADGLARAIAGDGLAAYEEERDEASREMFELTERLASFQWDLEEVKLLHRGLSETMNTEVAALAAREPPLRALAR